MLLKDMTTGTNIVWANGDNPSKEINCTEKIRPRALKDKKENKKRTKEKAEVFTPIKIIKKMNNIVDKKLRKESGDIKEYINKKILEITCGEGHFITTRYDPITGKAIDLERRVGMLDLKLREVNKYTNNQKEWLRLTLQALKSVYGYEYQGDNLYLARRNIYYTFIENYEHKFNQTITNRDIKTNVINIINWNIWQMDGLSYTIPYKKQQIQVLGQLDIFNTARQIKKAPIYAKIMNWNEKEVIEFRDIRRNKE